MIFKDTSILDPVERKEKAICRFGFPHPPMRELKILRPIETESDDFKERYNRIKQKLVDMENGEDITF